ncbi:hypothetical protein [Polyangium sp. y55x31]|uniref:hypothetical protein n=1 Tax=Polyangium sp. y55x31 TaxID=3042688 RepID=UPI0024822C68|nr:hypothetical protein [Polyangium sp. y55x31]MDI1477881.1 hypothetical protein [Polyangium sp. y55x31]
MHRVVAVFLGALGLAGVGCGSEEPASSTGTTDEPYGCSADAAPTRMASCVVAFEPGDDAGFGADRFPEVIYGEPLGNGSTSGGLDVLSLGRGGAIVLGFGGNAIVDGEGPDFVVFENPFYVSDDPNNVYAELAEVSVSADGETWHVFPCAEEAKPPAGCAGYSPVFANGDLGVSSLDPSVSGGDTFDLAELGVSEARFVRIRDLQGIGAAPNAGFDLDAIAVLHPKVP